MKHLLISTLILLLVPALCACGSQDDAPAEKSYAIAEAGSWTDGTYTAQADGYGGSFDVTVTISGGQIADITAGDNSETPEYGGAAIETMIPAMVEAQTYDVDATSGATTTSDSLRDAVARCLEQASE